MKKIIAVIFVALIFGSFWATRVQKGEVLIEQGESVSSVAASLKEAGIIRSQTVFKIAFKIFKKSDHVYPGTAVFEEACNIACVVREVTTTRSDAVKIVLTEGQDIHDLVKILSAKKMEAAKDFYEVVGRPATIPTTRSNFSEKFEFLKTVPKNISLEGYLFPDTYEFTSSATADQIVRAMLMNFDRKVYSVVRSEVQAQGKNFHDVVTMASILEKEVRKPEEQRMVADILWRRIDKGMGLQVDSSVSYISQSEGVFTTKKERSVTSLWNTYKFRGLPVGPIGNPGLEAIRAALNPTRNDYWFYLTSPDGTVHYAKTLEEHVANKRYLK